MIHFSNSFTYSLPMLKCTRESVTSIASTKWASIAPLKSNIYVDEASPGELGSMINGYAWEEQKKNKKNKVWMKEKGEVKLSFRAE